MAREMARLILCLLWVNLAACRPPIVPPLHEAEIAIQQSKKNTSGTIGILYSSVMGIQRELPNCVSVGYTSNDPTQPTAYSEVWWTYMGSSGGSDIYRLKRKETSGGLEDLEKASAQALTVRFNGKDPVVAWDDTRYIVIRPLSEGLKKDIMKIKSTNKVQGKKPLIGKNNYE